MTSASYAAIYRVVRRVPRGRVTTYGSVAVLAGLPRQPRLVGYALSALAEHSVVPWHRVVNAKGQISLSDANGAATTQRLRLEREGVHADAGGRVNLARYGWKPRALAL
jgi:methylated-DNA-protein-cysteine methyltransferase related protein